MKGMIERLDRYTCIIMWYVLTQFLAQAKKSIMVMIDILDTNHCTDLPSSSWIVTLATSLPSFTRKALSSELKETNKNSLLSIRLSSRINTEIHCRLTVEVNVLVLLVRM